PRRRLEHEPDKRRVVRISSAAKSLDPLLVRRGALNATRLVAQFVLRNTFKFVIGLLYRNLVISADIGLHRRVSFCKLLHKAL
ncbi:hypothetical protein, partial [Ascidiaceihabitans sp.]|uniref:hypothetical protein n=1 Tax=Ascidiaceihabitans sp. TaxID=1872644 RepID=UPI0032980182